VNELEKLKEDLSAVVEKVRLCREMLFSSPGIQTDEALSDVVGFLEACRDRLVDLVEAGTSGLLGEELFAHVLQVNDMVIRTLEAEKVFIFSLSIRSTIFIFFFFLFIQTGIRIDIDEGMTGGVKNSAEEKTSSLLDLDSPKPTATTIHDDLMGLMAPPANDNKVFPPPAPTTAASNDPFAVPATQPASTNQPAVNSPDEFDMLFNSTPSKVPPPQAQTQPPTAVPPQSTNPSNANNANPDDFDSFFASLK
jgi:hypothetical protein